MISIVKAVRVISSLGFLGVLLFVYAYLPNTVKLPLDYLEATEITMEKGNLFYTVIGVFALVSMVSFFATRMINTLPAREMNFKRNLNSWSISFMAIINIFLIFSLIIISIINDSESTVSSYYALLAYIGPILLVLWLVLLVFLITRRVIVKN
ncbi:hypothetical protein QQ020_32035 [Fulvivirgaceae bacterium BMA12]|uniref:DUF1648 domain-containing protein n=1 Tax=Agaribacillus aureus TaxID=3051825 RepID=A0ABT8LG20_9BACT|nr:hypothetical protein [Fulvivirgaceae bacterium BMA12]